MSIRTTSTESHALLLPDIIFEVVLHLDFHTLLRCQRVCHSWKSVIARSHQARQTLFQESDPRPFTALWAAEEHDMANASTPAFTHPQLRIPSRPEFRALFNPWIYTHDAEPVAQGSADAYSSSPSLFGMVWRRTAPHWRFTDRVSSGRLDFCFTPSELVGMVDDAEASWNTMFLTQPPVKRLKVSVQGGYMPDEEFDVEKEGGVRIGDAVAAIRGSKAVERMRGRMGEREFTTVDIRFDEHFTGVRFVQLQQCARDKFDNVYVLKS